jgi:hypothetical protein
MAGFILMGGRKQQRGGNNLPLSPESYESLGSDPMVPANYAKMPNVFPSNQVGGAAYGYAAGSDVTPYGGSYAPATPVCTGATIAGRGGNNIMQGGMKKKWRQRGCKSKKGCKGGSTKKRSTKKRSTKKRSTKKGSKTYKKNKRGGFIPLL